jgi:hypothetical protein
MSKLTTQMYLNDPTEEAAWHRHETWHESSPHTPRFNEPLDPSVPPAVPLEMRSPRPVCIMRACS